ncbi:MAG: DUF5615 family PIN-like protein [Bacteroidota bacterium]
MPIALYMDHHVPRAISTGLRLRGVDVLTAQDDGAQTLDDGALLDRSTALERVLFSQDDDFLIEAALRQTAKQAFAGIVYAHQLRISIGRCIRDLELIVKLGDPEELSSQVLFLPL